MFCSNLTWFACFVQIWPGMRFTWKLSLRGFFFKNLIATLHIRSVSTLSPSLSHRSVSTLSPSLSHKSAPSPTTSLCLSLSALFWRSVWVLGYEEISQTPTASLLSLGWRFLKKIKFILIKWNWKVRIKNLIT